MNKNGIFVIDLGTSKVHANVIDVRDGTLLVNEEAAYPWLHPEKNCTEIRCGDIWEAAQEACEKVVRKLNGIALTGLTFSWFGAELVTLDADGEEVFPLIVSFDARAGEEAAFLRERISADTAQYIGRGGLNEEANPAKVLWLKNHDPENFSRVRYIATVEQYFYAKLGFEICAERSMVQTLQFFKADGSILHEAAEAIGIPETLLDYPLQEGDGILGRISRFGRVELPSELPVLYGGHDCILSQLGSGVLPEGNGVLGDVSGTYDLMGFFRPIQCVSQDEIECINTPLSGYDSFMHGGPTGEILSSRVETLWGSCSGDLLTELFGAAIFDAEHGGLWKLKNWETVRRNPASLKRYGRMRVFESLVEEITFELKESYQFLCEKNGEAFSAVRVGGGASKSKSWLQLKADIFDASFELNKNPEISSMGAAVIAAVVLGVYPDYESALQNMVHVSERYDPMHARAYADAYAVWKKGKE